MSMGDNSTFPLPSRSVPVIPPLRRGESRDSENLSQSISQGSRMTVGPGIQLKGEISNCAALVVEGSVNATLNGEALEISQRGIFNGTARVENAEIQGQFDGDLTVTGLLRIENGGSVSGKVRYGRIEVISGGELSGEISKTAPEEGSAVSEEAQTAPEAAQTTPEEAPAAAPDNVGIAAEAD